MAKGNVLSSARVKLMFEGTPCMYCYGVDFSEQIQHEPIEPLDTLAVEEHVPLAYRVNFSAKFVRVYRQPLRLHQGIEIYPRLQNILQSSELTGAIEDRISGDIIANITGVRGEGRSTTIGNRAVIMVDATFVARKIIDESEI